MGRGPGTPQGSPGPPTLSLHSLRLTSSLLYIQRQPFVGRVCDACEPSFNFEFTIEVDCRCARLPYPHARTCQVQQANPARVHPPRTHGHGHDRSCRRHLRLRPERQPDRAARCGNRAAEVGTIHHRNRPGRCGPDHRSAQGPRQDCRSDHQRSTPEQPRRLSHPHRRRYRYWRTTWSSTARCVEYKRHARSAQAGWKQHRSSPGRDRQLRRLVPGLRGQE